MQTPLCSICQENDDILCNGCRSKLEDGELTEEAVELSQLLHDLSENIKTLEEVTVKKVIPSSDALVVLTGEGDGPRVVGRDGRIVKKMADRFEKSIRVVEDTGDINKVVDKLLAPAEYEGIRTVYKPEGQEMKVIVDRENERRVPFSREEFRDVVDQILGESILLSYE